MSYPTLVKNCPSRQFFTSVGWKRKGKKKEKEEEEEGERRGKGKEEGRGKEEGGTS